MGSALAKLLQNLAYAGVAQASITQIQAAMLVVKEGCNAIPGFMPPRHTSEIVISQENWKQSQSADTAESWPNARATPFAYKFIKKNQRDARKLPNTDLWKAAEEKELATLWGKEAFELVARPSEHGYDPLPLQFVYKLKVKDGDYDHGVPKAQCVAMGNLQYDHKYGDTYAPTARLWTVRTMAAIAAQEGLTMKKFDLTGAFLIADMDVPMHVHIPGYDLPKDKALLLKKALYGTKSRGTLYC